MRSYSVSETARLFDANPKEISDLLYRREIPDDLCPIVGGRRLIPQDCLPVIYDMLKRHGKRVSRRFPAQP